MSRKPLPEALTVELNSIYPRFACYVHDDRGTAHGGFWRGFSSHSVMFAWLSANGYATPGQRPE